MEALADHIWIFDGETVPFFTLPYSTRMTVVRLPGERLWVHSPIRLTDSLQQEVSALGKVEWLIAPNHLHHLFISDWAQAFPDAQTYGTREVAKKRPDIDFTGLLTEHGQYPWHSDIEQLLFTGSPAMQECVFFHRASSTLILTDLIENFNPRHFTPLKRLLARLSGILAPNGKTPIDWRTSFLFGKHRARQHVQTILNWQPQRIVMAHGEIIREKATEHFRKAFRWVW
ncbi:MAG: hypothetical protein CMI02_01405 [Oceanospirillaceae bacterium]|nr:hypothetical protein [Oceanospirillaceae bacterium]MBT10675.1 hypothetical protein [Oceanospirillaceae bacterium]